MHSINSSFANFSIEPYLPNETENRTTQNDIYVRIEVLSPRSDLNLIAKVDSGERDNELLEAAVIPYVLSEETIGKGKPVSRHNFLSLFSYHLWNFF